MDHHHDGVHAIRRPDTSPTHILRYLVLKLVLSGDHLRHALKVSRDLVNVTVKVGVEMVLLILLMVVVL